MATLPNSPFLSKSAVIILLLIGIALCLIRFNVNDQPARVNQTLTLASRSETLVVKNNYVVRFTEYKHSSEHLSYLKSSVRPAGWEWVELRNPAAKFPTDFGLVSIKESVKARIIEEIEGLELVKDVKPTVPGGAFADGKKRPGQIFTSMSFSEPESDQESSLRNTSLDWERHLSMQSSQVTSLFETDVKGYTGSEVKLCISDAGRRADHPFFRNIKRFYIYFTSWASKKAISGCLILFPIGVTFYTSYWSIQFIDGLFSPIYKHLGIERFGLGFITSMVFIFFAGVLNSSSLGAALLRLSEFFIERMPIVRDIYSASKKVAKVISPESFKEVGIVKHPRIGGYALGFITSTATLETNSGEEEVFCVYVPTNNLYIGDFFLLNTKELIRTDISVTEGIEMVVSVGINFPGIISERRQ